MAFIVLGNQSSFDGSTLGALCVGIYTWANSIAVSEADLLSVYILSR